jgi:cytochrome P450
VQVASDSNLYYDPFDIEIDLDPYPIWRRMRDEAPLYHNERYGFFALSRFSDVDKALIDWTTFPSSRGSVLEVLLANVELAPGLFLMEDPPLHTVHRGLMGRVFTPRRMNALEGKVRQFCASCLDPLLGSDRIDFVEDLGAQMPMRTIGMLLGVPERNQESFRDSLNDYMRVEDGSRLPPPKTHFEEGEAFIREYIEWRAANPSDDLVTELLNVEFEDETGTRRRLTRAEALTYVTLLAGAGNETTTRLIGWAGKILSEHANQRRELADDPSLIPQAVEEILRFESPSPALARFVSRDVEYYGETVPEGSAMVLLLASANRDDRQFPNAERFDIHRPISHHVAFGYGVHFCLGAALARLEGRVALDEILKRFRDWEIDWDGAVMAHTPTMRGWEKLPAFLH